MYEKQNFLPGQKLKAAQLNHMEEGIAAAVTIDLLWENHELKEGVVNSLHGATVPIPNLLEYDKIEIVHITDDSWVGSNSADVEIFRNWGTELFAACGENQSTRRVECHYINETHVIYFQDDSSDEGSWCIPVRIYGIKGVRSASALQTCRVDAESYDMISFERGMTWGEWCDSPYNAFEDLYYISDGVLHNGAGSAIIDPSVRAVSASDYIEEGTVYHGA